MYKRENSEIIRTVGQLKRLANRLEQVEEFAFDTETNTLRVYGDNSNYLGTFKGNNLTTLVIPKSVEYIGYTAFSNNNLTSVRTEANSNLKYLDSTAFQENPNLTQITLTSPKDLPGWPNVGTVDGKTVIYER